MGWQRRDAKPLLIIALILRTRPYPQDEGGRARLHRSVRRPYQDGKIEESGLTYIQPKPHKKNPFEDDGTHITYCEVGLGHKVNAMFNRVLESYLSR